MELHRRTIAALAGRLGKLSGGKPTDVFSADHGAQSAHDINLKKTSQGVTSVTTRKGFYVYPNPFSDGLNISFYQQKEAEVSVTINKTSGERVYSASLGKYAEGQQDITLPLKLASGVYLLKVSSGKAVYQTVVIRK